jgi:hypothetical protein
MLQAEDFGAIGDGERDDTVALQAALSRAEGSGLRLRARPYAVRDTLLIPTNCVLEGRGAVIHQKSDDKPILASLAWAGRGPTKGYTRILGLRLQGTGRGERQDGIVLHDYWSEIADVEVVEPGGRGIVLAEEDQRGSRPSSTLVENRIRNCVVRHARRSAFFLGKPANGKLTDGELSNCIASLHDSAREPAVAIGHSAGWIVNGLHSYGGQPRAAIEIHNPFFTSLSNLYLEGFEEAGLAINGVQTSVSVSSLHIIAKRFGRDAAFIKLSGHGAFETSTAHLASIGLWNDGPKSGHRRAARRKADPAHGEWRRVERPRGGQDRARRASGSGRSSPCGERQTYRKLGRASAAVRRDRISARRRAVRELVHARDHRPLP